MRVGLDEIHQFRGADFFGIRIRVVTIREQDHLHVHAFFQDQVDPAERRFDTRRIAIIQDRDVAGVAFDQFDLFLRQGSTRGRNHVCNTHLMHGDHIRVSLTQETVVVFDDIAFGKIQSIQDLTLVVDHTLRRVEVFGYFLIGEQGASSKSKHTTGNGMDREHDTTAEEIEMAIFFRFHQAHFFQVFQLVAFCQ